MVAFDPIQVLAGAAIAAVISVGGVTVGPTIIEAVVANYVNADDNCTVPQRGNAEALTLDVASVKDAGDAHDQQLAKCVALGHELLPVLNDFLADLAELEFDLASIEDPDVRAEVEKVMHVLTDDQKEHIKRSFTDGASAMQYIYDLVEAAGKRGEL
jgi:hypothetical protein